MTDVNAKIALVIGGGRGLGRSEVIALATRGVHCIFTYSAHRDEAEQVAHEARTHGVQAVVLHLDLADVPSFDAFATKVGTALKGLGAERFHYLVNNGGISFHRPFAEITEADLDRQYAVNFKGVFFITQKMLPLISDGGRIINTSSGSTRFVFTTGMIAYSSIKGAIETFTKYLAQELGPRGITVNAIAPGPMGTDFANGMIRDNAEYREGISKATALGRVGVPDDIGPMVASLLSDDNRWLSGQRIEVSGGMKL